MNLHLVNTAFELPRGHASCSGSEMRDGDPDSTPRAGWNSSSSSATGAAQKKIDDNEGENNAGRIRYDNMRSA